MEDKEAGMSKETEIKLLTMHFIQNKATDSALDFVKLYRETQEEMKAAYYASEKPFNIDAML